MEENSNYPNTIVIYVIDYMINIHTSDPWILNIYTYIYIYPCRYENIHDLYINIDLLSQFTNR